MAPVQSAPARLTPAASAPLKSAVDTVALANDFPDKSKRDRLAAVKSAAPQFLGSAAMPLRSQPVKSAPAIVTAPRSAPANEHEVSVASSSCAVPNLVCV